MMVRTSEDIGWLKVSEAEKEKPGEMIIRRV